MMREREGGNRYLCERPEAEPETMPEPSRRLSLAAIDKIGTESILNNYESCIKDSRSMK